MDAKIDIIMAPNRVDKLTKYAVFLAGRTSGSDWRKLLAELLTSTPITLLNPSRSDWDSTWVENNTDSRWAEQISWELDMQDAADSVAFFFDQASDAPISLLEFGLAARTGKALVCVSYDYSKRGNIEAVCAKYKIPLFSTLEGLKDGIIQNNNQK